MLKSRAQNLIWLFCFLIILEVIWVEIRLQKLTSTQNLVPPQSQELVKEDNLLNEPSIKQKLSFGAKLWLKPESGLIQGITTFEVWASTIDPVAKIDLRIFFPPTLVQIIDEDWWVGERSGIAVWSGEITDNAASTSTKAARIIKTITVKPLKSGVLKLDFDFVKGSLLDSNVLNRSGEDMLEEAIGGEYQINL
ncbi:hypothetical protein ACFLZ1_02425 [Patescibacteria group bacterium]